MELYGGPMDGAAVVIYAPAWNPPTVLKFPARPAPAPGVPLTLTSAPMVIHSYDRRPSPDENGPPWRYEYRGTA
jgi:hypothetical protein